MARKRPTTRAHERCEVSETIKKAVTSHLTSDVKEAKSHMAEDRALRKRVQEA